MYTNARDIPPCAYSSYCMTHIAVSPACRASSAAPAITPKARVEAGIRESRRSTSPRSPRCPPCAPAGARRPRGAYARPTGRTHRPPRARCRGYASAACGRSRSPFSRPIFWQDLCLKMAEGPPSGKRPRRASARLEARLAMAEGPQSGRRPSRASARLEARAESALPPLLRALAGDPLSAVLKLLDDADLPCARLV
jgi:hypothetical protein